MQQISIQKIFDEINREASKRRVEGVYFSAKDAPVRYSLKPTKRETKLYRILKRNQGWIRKYLIGDFIYSTVYKFKNIIPQFQECIRIDELMKYHDDEFIKNAYRGIMKREPHYAGFDYYLTQLRQGRLSKSEILCKLRYSKEGKEKDVKITGLAIRAFINTSFRFPVIGYLFKLVISLVRLPQIIQNIHVAESFTSARFTQVALDVKQVGCHVNDVQTQIEGLQTNIIQKVNDHQINILELQRSLRLLFDELKNKLAGSISADQIKYMAAEEEHLLDALYVAFEDRFRGRREEIRERTKVYLPYVEQASASKNDLSVLDIGCGRGEWLELLKECGYKAKGIDTNRVMVQMCREIGLDVEEADAIHYLRRQERDTISVITGLHIVEHLSFQTLVRLLDEAHRTLKPGGFVIFETPNAETLIVGARNFYLDPTHRNPILPDTLKFIFEERGFLVKDVLRLHKFDMKIDDTQLQNILFGPQDYGMVGVKL